jgi:hypothetical protein
MGRPAPAKDAEALLRYPLRREYASTALGRASVTGQQKMSKTTPCKVTDACRFAALKPKGKHGETLFNLSCLAFAMALSYRACI